MTWKIRALMAASLLSLSASIHAQTSPGGSNVRPPVTKDDLRIVRRAEEILNSPAVWNRADNRVCPADAKIFSLYCALEKAAKEVDGSFQHRGAAMQEARFVIEEITVKRDYQHRLMDYNNDPATTFADIHRVFRLLEKRIAERLAKSSQTKE